MEDRAAAEVLEPRVIGAIQRSGGVLLAVPLNPALSSDAQKALDLFATENPEVIDFTTTRRIALPTPGVSVDGRLGACNCCEDDITERQKLGRERIEADTALVAQQAAKTKQEGRRLRLRLDSEPPDLSDPTAATSIPPVHVIVSNDETDTPTP